MKNHSLKRKVATGSFIIIFLLVAFALVCPLNSSTDYCEIHPDVAAMLDQLSISDCYVKSIGPYEGILYELSSPEISDEQIQEYIDSVKSEYGIHEITGEFLSDQFACTSAEEFYELVKNRLLEQKKVEILLSTRKLIMEQLIAQSVFELDKEIVAKYSLQIINSYETNAYLYDLSLEEYCIKVLNVSYDEFFQQCYEEGESTIKTFLIIGAIAFNELERVESIASPSDDQDIYYAYQKIENQVYGIFISTTDDF